MRFLICVVSVVAGLIAPGTAGAVIFSWNPSSQVISQGTPVSVDLVVSDLGGSALGAFDVNVSFAPGILGLSGVTFGSLLGDPITEALALSTPGGPGTVELTEVSFLAPADLLLLQSSSFSVATLQFDTLGVGSSPLDISILSVSDANGGELSATSQSGVVTVRTSVAEVAEPATLMLLTAGLVLTGGLAPVAAIVRRRRA